MSNITLFEKCGLKGQKQEVSNGYFTTKKLLPLSNFSMQSAIIPPKCSLIVFVNDNFVGPRYVFNNPGNQSKKILNFGNSCLSIRSLIVNNSYIASKKDKNIVEINIDKSNIVVDDINLNYFAYIPTFIQTDVCRENAFKGIILILHDIGINKNHYVCLCDYYSSKGYVVIIMDHRNHGFSDDDVNVTFNTIINDNKILLEHLNLMDKTNLIVIGHGYGGAIAQYWAMNEHFIIDKLILINPFSIFKFGEFYLPIQLLNQWKNNMLTFQQYSNIMSNLTYNLKSNDNDVEKLKEKFVDSNLKNNPFFIQKMFNLFDDIENSSILQNILTKTLLILSNQNAIVDTNIEFFVKSYTKNLQVRFINSGHSPHDTEFFKIIDHVTKFIANCNKRCV